MARTVLITGASRGIGAAAARRFAEAGDRVAVNYTFHKNKAEELAAELKSRGFRPKFSGPTSPIKGTSSG